MPRRSPWVETSFNRVFQELFFCPACTTWRHGWGPRPAIHRSVRRATTLSSSTAINASKDLNPRLLPLYDALGVLRRRAPAHVNISRLQLARQGLESASPKIRIAVLGLNVQKIARRIVRLLLADALEKEQKWEKELLRDQSYDQGVILRYGQPPNRNLPQPKTAIPVLHIPASILERNSIEILISAVSPPSSGRNQATPIDTFLSPTLGTPTATTGRQTIISQPVHSTLLVTQGLDEFLAVARLLASTDFASPEDRQLINVVLDQAGAVAKGEVTAIDTAKAEEGLEAIRNSVGQAATYERLWTESNLPAASRWLTLTAKSGKPLPATILTLISSVLTSTKVSLLTQASVENSSNQAFTTAVASNLGSSIEEFSRNAHLELQSGLASAWSSRNWKKLAWYKLFWRVDDVGLIVSDLINNAWLPRTEKAVYEISGRLAQAGISPVVMATPSATSSEAIEPSMEPTLPAAQPLQVLQGLPSNRPQLATPIITNPSGTATVQLQPSPQPTPLSSTLSTTRSTIIASTITSLTNTAQQLLFRTLSIASLSSGLSGLTYLSLTNSLYEAGTIAALGTAYALYSMQGMWQRATRRVEDELYDDGKEAIRLVVGRMRRLVEDKMSNRGDEEGRRWLEEGLEAVERARGELDKLLEGEEDRDQKK